MLLAPTAAQAQRYLGGISGLVTDPSGAKVAGVKVTATEAATKYTTQVITSDVAAYNMPALQPGTYSITVKSSGFRTETRTGVVLTAGQSQIVDFSLAVATANESVEVSAEASLLDTGSANIATTLSNQEVTDLPNNGRNPYVMATLAAGVINTGSGGYFQGKSSQFTNPFSGVAVQITSDGSSGHNRLTLDGIPNDSAERLSGASYTNFVPSPEAVQEVKVQSSIFDAEVGHGNGTVTNTVVRSGNNQLHGAAYYVFQNTYLNSNTTEKALTHSPRNNDQLSQTGFVLDGPVYIPRVYNGRNKTFFMVAFERYASHSAINYSSRMPTQAERGGNFSDLCSSFNGAGLCTSGAQIYDPQSPIDSSGQPYSVFSRKRYPNGTSDTGRPKHPQLLSDAERARSFSHRRQQLRRHANILCQHLSIVHRALRPGHRLEEQGQRHPLPLRPHAAGPARGLPEGDRPRRLRRLLLPRLPQQPRRQH